MSVKMLGLTWEADGCNPTVGNERFQRRCDDDDDDDDVDPDPVALSIPDAMRRKAMRLLLGFTVAFWISGS